MKGTPRLPLVALVALAAVLTVGVAAASAHRGGPGGPGGPGGHGLRGPSPSALVTEAAKQLGVTRAALVAAIQKSAKTQIDEAVEDEAITAARAAGAKEAVEDNLSLAYRLSRASTVASNLGVTTAKLNTEFRDARRALATARIDAALAAGRITSEQATQQKQRLAEAELPGYKPARIGLAGGKRGR